LGISEARNNQLPRLQLGLDDQHRRRVGPRDEDVLHPVVGQVGQLHAFGDVEPVGPDEGQAQVVQEGQIGLDRVAHDLQRAVGQRAATPAPAPQLARWPH
jgi:hypothetical protein